MKHLLAGFGLSFGLLAAPACAQLSAGGSGGGGPGSGGGAPSVQPRPATPDIAPPGLPGAAQAPVATGPVVQKQASGDPTAELFTAVNNADYNSALDAISRGADVNARNGLGETPLDLSIALNHNDITFMLLSARDEGGGPPPLAASAPVVPPAAPAPQAAPPAFVASPSHAPAPLAASDHGTPDPEAGFLGFGPTK